MARHWHDGHFHDSHWQDGHWIGLEADVTDKNLFVEAIQIGQVVEAIQVAGSHKQCRNQ